ncbi:MAG: hypothetical protein H6772_00945 [Pseudomonadales bacterium]|nr:hypothetical protein [Pseudomonadales bacterium]
MFPDGLPKEVEIIPHAQTLSGQGNIFILVDNRSGFPQVKYIKTEINSMIIKRDPNLLRELSRDFDFQYNNADTEFNIVRPNGTAHDANAINKVITLPNAVRAIVMNQVLDSRNLLDELSLANEDKHIFLKNAAQELASFLKLFLTMYSDPGTFPKDWGLEDSRAFSPEFKGVGFFPKTTNDLAPNIGIYDFTVLARNTSYVPTIEKKFLCNIPALLLSMSGHSDLLSALTDLSPAALRRNVEYGEFAKISFISRLKEQKLQLKSIFEDMGFPELLPALEEALMDPPIDLRGTRVWTQTALEKIIASIT